VEIPEEFTTILPTPENERDAPIGEARLLAARRNTKVYDLRILQGFDPDRRCALNPMCQRSTFESILFDRAKTLASLD
jgi:hypothetical protein